MTWEQRTNLEYSSWRLNAPAVAGRRLLLAALVLGTTAIGLHGIGSVLGGAPFGLAEWLIIGLFTVLFSTTCLWFWTTTIGILLRLLGRHPVDLGRWHPDPADAPPLAATAIVMPAYNEDMDGVANCIAATWRSLEATGESGHFDFYLLSDSGDEDRRATERQTVAALRQRLGPGLRLYYRARDTNEGRKPGNIRDFCERWGDHYDYMIIFDADSRMTGESMITLVRRMQANPQAGILQTVPLPVGQRSLLGRLQQLAASLSAPSIATGLAFWQVSHTNYWGHNAIVRIRDFRDCCGLPPLPGEAPLGGDIMSHDYVEAGLMHRHGRGVYVLPEIEGSFEGMPGNLIDDLKRERRWCQGNLQHLRLLPGRGWPLITRFNYLVGGLAYVNAPLWMLLVSVAAVDAMIMPESTWLGAMADPSSAAVWLIALTVFVLFAPKVFNLGVALSTARSPGYALRLLGGGLTELVFSVLRAPVMMLLYSVYVGRILRGRPAGWSPQLRGRRTVPPGLAWRLGAPMAAGALAVAAVVAITEPAFLPWLSPVLLGPMLYPLILDLTSRVAPAWLVPSTPEEDAGRVPMNRRVREQRRHHATPEPQALSYAEVPTERFRPMPLQPLSVPTTP